MSRLGMALIAALLSMFLLGCAPTQQAAQIDPPSPQSAEAPKMKVGDKWVFVHRINPSMGRRYPLIITQEVTKVYPDGSWEEMVSSNYDEEKYRFHYSGHEQGRTVKIINLSTDETKETIDSANPLNFPLMIGDKWSAAGAGRLYYLNMNHIFNYEVKSWERKKVKAGTFLSYKIKLDVVDIHSKHGHSDMTRYYWYAPKVKKIIKYEPDKDELDGGKELIEYHLAK